jgi:hypothetical protein
VSLGFPGLVEDRGIAPADQGVLRAREPVVGKELDEDSRSRGEEEARQGFGVLPRVGEPRDEGDPGDEVPARVYERPQVLQDGTVVRSGEGTMANGIPMLEVEDHQVDRIDRAEEYARFGIARSLEGEVHGAEGGQELEEKIGLGEGFASRERDAPSHGLQQGSLGEELLGELIRLELPPDDLQRALGAALGAASEGGALRVAAGGPAGAAALAGPGTKGELGPE